MLSQAATDTVTTITCLGGALAGATSERIGNMLGSMIPGKGSRGTVGEVGLDFCVRAFTSAVAFNLVATYMPQTADNIAFSILFFAAQPTLVREGVQLANMVVGGFGPILGAAKLPQPPSPHGPGAKTDCSCKH